jgi:hypothetical protein
MQCGTRIGGPMIRASPMLTPERAGDLLDPAVFSHGTEEPCNGRPSVDPARSYQPNSRVSHTLRAPRARTDKLSLDEQAAQLRRLAMLRTITGHGSESRLPSADRRDCSRLLSSGSLLLMVCPAALALGHEDRTRWCSRPCSSELLQLFRPLHASTGCQSWDLFAQRPERRSDPTTPRSYHD